MKKIATLVALILTIMTICAVPALASQPDYPNSNPSRWAKDTDQEFKEWEKGFSERGTGYWYKAHNMMICWFIESQQNHQYVIPRRYPRKNFLLHSERIDFVEVGKLYEAKNDEEIEKIRQSFIENPVDEAIKFIASIQKEEFEYADRRQEILEKNIPIYWNVKPMKWDPNFYVIEVAIGKYVIQQGDTLSKIAEQFDTSVDEIMEKNKNIENPDLIYAGNYLCIW